MPVAVEATDANVYKPIKICFLIKLKNHEKINPATMEISTTKILKSYTGILKENNNSLFFWLNTKRAKINNPANLPEEEEF